MPTYNTLSPSKAPSFSRGLVTISALVTASVLGIASQQMKDGTITVAYSDTVIAIGGFAPVTFAVTSGSLPASLTLNSTTGVISGTPTVAASSTFTITGTDSHGNTSSRSFTIVISAASSGGEVSYTFAS